MDYCKYQADYLFTGEKLLTDRQVLITDSVGTVIAVTDEIEAGDDIRRLKGMLSPGFINCHCHLELSHMKGMIAKHLGMTAFLRWVVQHRGFSQEMIQEGIRNGEQEMLDNGIVAVGDISNTGDTIEVKSHRRLRYQNFVEALGFNDAKAEATMQYCNGLQDQFQSATGFPATVVPHAPYTMGKALFELIRDASVGKVISMHNQESLQEEQFMISGTGGFREIFEDLKMNLDDYHGRGKNSLQFAWTYLSLAQKSLLIHNVTTKQEDIDLFSPTFRKQLYWCLCVNANLYVNDVLPPVELFRNNGSKLVLGTDSLASNDTLSVLDEIKSLTKHFQTIPQEEMLRWATSNGADALNFTDRLGSFQTDKTPGVVLIEGLEKGLISASSSVRRLI